MHCYLIEKYENAFCGLCHTWLFVPVDNVAQTHFLPYIIRISFLKKVNLIENIDVYSINSYW